MGLKMREIGFQRTYIFKIFRGSMPPDPPRKVRLRRTITFSITYEHPLENLSYVPDPTVDIFIIITMVTIFAIRGSLSNDEDDRGENVS